MVQSRSQLRPKARRAQPAASVELPAASPFRIRLLGGFELRAADGATLTLSTRKAEALIALLAIRPGQLWNRDKICALLWPDVREVQARHSLRQTLLSVRKVLPEHVLKAHGRALFLDPASVEVDAALLTASAADPSFSALTRAAALYQGELLEGSSVVEQPFEHWLTSERERLRSLMVQGLSRLTDLHSDAGQLAAASEACAQLLRLDPLREEAHRALMRLYLRQGRRGAALQQYHTLARILESELGTAPEPETEQLFYELSHSVAAVLAASPQDAGSTRAQTSVPALLAGGPAQFEADGLAAPAPEPVDAVVPLIGRANELAALEDAYLRAQKRRSRVALVLGEAGVGKTRLSEQFATTLEARGTRVLRARCYESEQVLPFALWSNALRAAAIHQDASFRKAVPEHVRRELCQLLPALAPAAGQEPARTRDVLSLFQALRWVLGWLGQAAPLVLWLDDLHWCDEMSLRALCFLSRQEPGARPCLFLATAREEELTSVPQLTQAVRELERDRLLARVPLGPLSRDETALLAERLILLARGPVRERDAQAQGVSALSADWAERIWAISEGNPLVVVESARALANGAMAGDVASLPVPERVRALILERFARSSGPARELLTFAAVVGRELPLDLLRRPGRPEARASAREQSEDRERVAALEELVAARFLRADEQRVSFTHDRIRETIYADLLPARRQLLHGSVARALEELHHEQLDEVSGLIAYHHSKAGNAFEAVPLLLRFSERAWHLHGVNEALAALEQALADSARLPSAERLPIAITIVLQQAKCFAFLGRLHELIARLAQYEPAVRELDQPALSGPFYFWWGFAETLAGARASAQERAERALAQASLCDDQLIIGYSHSVLSYLCAVRGQSDQGIQHGLTATTLLGDGATLPEGTVLAWLNLGLNYHARGDWRNAMAAAERASAMASAAESKRGESLAAAAIASIFALTECWEEALAHCARAVEASQEPFVLVQALWVFGWAQTGSGRPDMAIAVLERALAELEQHGMRGFMVVGLVYLAEAQLAHGDAQSALSSAQRAQVQARESEAVWLLGMALRTAGCAALALQRVDWARSQLGDALALFESCAAELEIGHTLYWQAKLECAVGERDLARTLFARARAVFAALEIERAVARLDLHAAQLSLS